MQTHNSSAEAIITSTNFESEIDKSYGPSTSWYDLNLSETIQA